MDIKKLNESIEKILYEGWNSGGYNELFANITLQSAEEEERLLELVSSATSLAVLLNKLKEEKIDYYFYTILDEESFDAQSLDQLKADISGYYSEFYSNVMVSISEDAIETSNEGVIIGTVHLEVYDEEEPEEDEYEDEDDEEKEKDNRGNFLTFAEWFGQDLTGQIYDGDINVGRLPMNIKSISLEGAPKEITGNFECTYCGLTSLKGAPEKVGGDFNCEGNKITSLQHAPKEVGGSFYCSYNRLTSLKGAPEIVKGGFGCYGNRLTSLKDAPQEVGGGFNCGGNLLTSLKGAPQEVGGSFYCNNNDLTTLEDAPNIVGETFDCSNNKLTSLRGVPQKIGGDFNCYDNPDLESLDGLGEVGGEIIPPRHIELT